MNDPDSARSSHAMHLFIDRVRAAGGPVWEAETEALARATLRHLGEQISPGQAAALTGALPPELAAELTRDHAGQAGGFDRDAFIDAVSTHVHGTDTTEVERQVRAVLSALRRGAPDRTVEETTAQLPAQLAALFV